MNSPDEASYIHTKELLMGKRQLSAPYDLMLEWVKENYPSTTPINIYYDNFNYRLEKHQRLNIIFLRSKDVNLFRENLGKNRIGNYKKNEQDNFKKKFFSLLKSYTPNIQIPEKLLVIFNSFDLVARREIFNHFLKSDDYNKFCEHIKNEEIWKISPYHGSIWIFFQTEKILHNSNNQQEYISKIFGKYFLPLDKFGVCEQLNLPINFEARDKFHSQPWRWDYRGR